VIYGGLIGIGLFARFSFCMTVIILLVYLKEKRWFVIVPTDKGGDKIDCSK
jgi:hypothetical protein